MLRSENKRLTKRTEINSHNSCYKLFGQSNHFQLKETTYLFRVTFTKLKLCLYNQLTRKSRLLN